MAIYLSVNFRSNLKFFLISQYTSFYLFLPCPDTSQTNYSLIYLITNLNL
jgi:hypothetical protein